MKPTPTETSCPSLDDLLRLHQQTLAQTDADRLHAHLRSCEACRQIWDKLRQETAGGPTPPELHRIGDTNLGPSARPPSSAIVWSSEIGIEGSGGQRAPLAPATSPDRKFSFLSRPIEEGELGWLGHYRITGLLGEGGMGYVFDAFDTHLHRRVAVKVLKPELAANDSFRERFLQEARAAAMLPDEYIITIYHVGVEKEKDVPFLAMKYLHGESLEHRLHRDRKIPIVEVLRIGRDVALGLSAAHDCGLIHRDIKPANLWLETPAPEQTAANTPRLSFEQAYRVKILDFGLVRPVNDSRRLTGTGLIVGTPQYLAPEQARGLPLDHRCDLFSLGIVLYRMVAGSLPFDGPDTLAQLTALAVSEPPPLEKLAPEVPEGLRNLIHQLLARDPAQRPPTARAVAERLRALEKKALSTTDWEPLADSGQTKKYALPSLPLPPQAGRRWLLASGLLGLLLVGGLLLWAGLRREQDGNAAAGPGGEPIKIGILFSQRGPMAGGGFPAHDAADLAVEELNKQGGLLGRPIEALHGDGQSDSGKFAEQAEKLITQDGACALFGPRASSHRKAIRPIVEKHKSVLFYPMQFEGLERSPNIVYLGAAPNQQMLPAVDQLLEKPRPRRRLFLVGSDYVYPHAANEILKDHVLRKYLDARILDEQYISFGGTQVTKVINLIKEKKPDLILSTVVGDSNTAFYRQYSQAGLDAKEMPILSFTLTELDLITIGEVGQGHYAAWSYFQSTPRPENEDFVRKFHKRFGDRRVISDTMETMYFAIHLWAKAVQEAGSVEPQKVLETIKGQSLEAPEGTVRVDRDTRYTWRVMRIGRIQKNGQFDIIFNTEWAFPPEPFPSTRPRKDWDAFLENLYKGWGNRWTAEGNKG